MCPVKLSILSWSIIIHSQSRFYAHWQRETLKSAILQLSDICDRDHDLWSGQIAHRRVTLINLYIPNFVQLGNYLWTDGQTYVQCESKKSPPTVFWNFFPNGWELFINFLHTYYTIISTLVYKFLFKYLQLWQSYAILSAIVRPPSKILHFTRTLTSKFAYWTNDVIVDVMSYPTCLLTL